MSGLNSLRTIFQKKGEDFVQKLMSSYVVINEKLDGSYFATSLDSCNEFKFFKKGGEITYADRVLNRFYNKAIQHFETFTEDEKLQIPSFYLFAFQYFARTGDLFLSHIHEMGVDGSSGKTLQSKSILDAWAETLRVRKPPILFEGYLSDVQKQELAKLIGSSLEEYKHIPFERILLSIFGINEERSIGQVVFRFYDGPDRNEERSTVAKMVSPSIEAMLQEKKPIDPTKVKADDFMWLILVDVMNYIESFSIPQLQEIHLASGNPHMRYVELINALYNKYIKENGEKWKGLELQTPEYLRTDDFQLNTDLIHNSETRDLVGESEINREIYRITINMFRNPEVRISSKIFTESMQQHLRAQIAKLSAVTNGKRIAEEYFPTFIETLGETASYSIFEDAEDPPLKKSEVNVIVDYFQPVNKSHLSVAQKLMERNGLPTVLVAVSQVSDREKYPMETRVVQDLLEKTALENQVLITGIRTVSNWSLEAIVESLGSQTIHLLACTSKRIVDFAQHAKYHQRRSSQLFESIENLQLVEVEHNDYGDRLREAILNRDIPEFESMTPESIHSEFESIAEAHCSKPVSAQTQLDEHYNFLRMIIGDDSNVTVETQSAILESLNTVKLKIDAEPVILAIKESLLQRNIHENDVNRFLEGLLQDPATVGEDLSNLRELLNEGIELHSDSVVFLRLDEIFEHRGIRSEILDRILAFKLDEHTNSGTGEFAATVLFRKGRKLSQGDVMIGEMKVEVKNNVSQLLSIKSINEESTFKESSEVVQKKLGRLKVLIIESGSENVEIALSLIDEKFAEKANFNFNQKGIRNYVNLINDVRALVPEISTTKLYEWFSNIFWGGILSERSKLPGRPERRELNSRIQQVFESGRDVKTLLCNLTFVAFKYYANVENFAGMLVFRNDHESTHRACVYVPESISFPDYMQYIEPITGPSLVDPRTAKSFKIRMRPQE